MMASQTGRDGFRSTADGLTWYRPVRWLGLFLFVALTFALTACAPSARSSREPAQAPAQAPQAEGTIVNVSAKISGFSLDRTSADAGVITFVVKNADAMPHDFMIEGNGISESTPRIAPGESASLTVDLKPGTYNYVCTVDGHGQVMHGTFTVES